jgi:hypothetical protein
VAVQIDQDDCAGVGVARRSDALTVFGVFAAGVKFDHVVPFGWLFYRVAEAV